MADDGDLPEVEAAAPAGQPALTRDDLRPRRSLPLSNETVGLMVVAALGILMVGFILGRVTAPDSAEDALPGTAPAPTETPGFDFPEGDVDRTGYWGFAQITAVASDSFDRDPSAGLGEADVGGRWQVVRGDWTVEDDHAALGSSPGDRPSIAVLSGGSTAELVEMTLVASTDGAGLVFRYRDADNFWAVTSADSGTSWEVTKVVDGQIALTDNFENPSADGSTIAVSQRPGRLLFLVEGVIEHQINDTALGQESRAGFIALPGTDDSARWDRFFIGNLPPEG